VSEQFVSPEVLAGGSVDGQSKGNVYVEPLEGRTVAELVQMVDTWFKRSVENRRHVENQTLLNLAFHMGQQYVRIDPTASGANRVVPVEKKRGQVRTVDNLIDPAVRSEKARLLRTRPLGTVVPQGDDAEDHEAAQAATMAVEHAMREGGWEEALEEAADWAMIGGVGHIGVSWEEYLSDSFGQRGLITYRALSPFEIAVPHLRRPNIDDQPYVMVTKAYEVDEIEARWGVRVAPDREEQFGSYDERLLGVITGRGRERSFGHTNTYDKKVPVAIVKETWIKPSQAAPNGAIAIVSSGQLLQYIPQWPAWCNGRYPFAKVSYTDIPGAYWDKALVSDLVPLQRRHNRAASVMVELLGMLSHTAVSVPRGTKVKSFLSGRGTMLETPPGVTTPTTPIQVTNAGNLPILELDQTRQAVRDAAFFHEVSRGTTPPNVRSGTAIMSLKELDDAAAAIPIRSIERATQRMGRFALDLVREKWTEDRLVLVFGQANDVEMRSFTGNTSAAGHFYVQPGSAWPVTKAQRQQMVLELYQNQLIGPEEALVHLEVGTPQSIRNDRYRDVRHARREHQKYEALSPINPQTGQVDQQSMARMMAQAQAINPASWHNHQVHLKEHNNLRKSPAYERWEPWKKELFEAHIMGHQVALEQQLLQQLEGPGGALRSMQQQAAGEQQARREAAATASERLDALRQQQMQAQQMAQQAAQQAARNQEA